MNEVQTTRLQFELDINAPLEPTWRALIDDINVWWSKDFHTSSKTKEVILEAKPGGRLFEDYGSNEGLVWGEIVILDAPHLIEFRTHLSPRYGGPYFSFLSLSLSSNQGQTKFALSEVGIGNRTQESHSKTEGGWRHLFEEGFKAFVEGKHLGR